nr:retrovirus-related Pol polyprotein from transposon TNT 1-94 [Tanacetum cinerariifolium]
TEAKAFLADVECIAPYDQPLAITTTNIFEVSHENTYDSDVDEGPHAAAAFMANLSSTSGKNGATTSHVNEEQLQGKKDTIKKLQTQINSMSILNVEPTVELPTSNSHSRDTLTRKITALTAENAKLKSESLSKMHSEPIVPKKPKVLAPGILTEKWLTFSQGLRNANLTQTLYLEDIYGRFVYEDNLIQKDERSSGEYLRDLDVKYQERALLKNSKCFIKRRKDFSSQKANENTECYKCGNKGHFTRDCFSKMSNPSYQSPVNNFSSTKGLVVEIFDWDEEEVSDEEEVTQVKVLMTLDDDKLIVRKNHARNGKWVDITMRKVNTLLSMDEDTDSKKYLKYINIDLMFVEEQRLNLLSKYNKIVFELNKCRDELLSLKQAKLDVVTLQIQNTKLKKLNHALQEQLKEEKKINEKWLTSSKKVSQCISEQIPHQKKKVLGGELLTESLSKVKINENSFIPASMGILVPESQAINESLETLNTTESSKDSEAEFLTLQKRDQAWELLQAQRGGVLAESSQTNTCRSTVYSTSDHNEFDHFKRDSGCSRSMTGVKSYLHKYVEQPGPKGYGSINYGGIVFTKVAFVNGLKYNLISVSQLCDAKYIIQFDDKKRTIFNAKKDIVLIAPRRNNVYVLDMSSLTPNGAYFFAKASESVNWLWHKRLSYLNFKNINKLAKQNKVLGHPSLVYSKDKPFIACENRKHHRASFKTK